MIFLCLYTYKMNQDDAKMKMKIAVVTSSWFQRLTELPKLLSELRFDGTRLTLVDLGGWEVARCFSWWFTGASPQGWTKRLHHAAAAGADSRCRWLRLCALGFRPFVTKHGWNVWVRLQGLSDHIVLAIQVLLVQLWVLLLGQHKY